MFLKDEDFPIPATLDDGSVDASGLPTGLLSLAGGAIHRALLLFTATGVRVEKPPNFGPDTSATPVASYIKNIRRFTWTRWSSILTSSGARIVDSIPLLPDPSSLLFDTFRDEMYMPSSPPVE
ncbi:hypothetical protein B0H10DRAFT_1964851 [Mycena sp. CBHHK59/15]|nr:hypothetical protein B0H10DRAFT_1964851 [Mycena sp. CBHHK59/15]